MAGIGEFLASYVKSMRFEELLPEAVHRLKALLIDTLGCAIAGYNAEPAKIARRIAASVYRCDTPATALGGSQRSSPELATFANGVAIRFLDFNDGYIAGGDRGGGHPSDNFAPLLACADAIHANGRDLIVAAAVAYEVFCRLSDRFSPSSRGFDQAVTVAISSAAGVSKLLGLSCEQTLQALNITVVSNIALGQTREGVLSMWKGCAVANAARNAVFAVQLAKEGMTGPNQVFEGRSGFFKALGTRFQLDELGGKGKPFRIMDVLVKRYPCGMVAQTAVDAAIKLQSMIRRVDEIAQINVGTTTSARNAMADTPEKWHPSSRESADHSLPYVVALALIFGAVEKKHFGAEYLNNPQLAALIQKIHVEESPECNHLFPEASANRIEIITDKGEKFIEMVRYHRGHPKNPMTDIEIEEKFHSLTAGLLSLDRRKEILSLTWNLEQVEDITTIIRFLEI